MQRFCAVGLLLIFQFVLTNLSAQQQRTELVVQTGHTGQIHALAFSPDGDTIASGSIDGTLKLWDAATGQELRTIATGANRVKFAPDGKTIASVGSYDHSIKLWDVATGNELKNLEGNRSSVSALAFSPDGTTLGAGYLSGDIVLWNVISGQEIKSIKAHAEFTNAIAFSPDGKQLISGGNDKTIRLWNVAAGKEVRVFKGHADSVDAVTFSPDGKTIASGSDDQTIKTWEVASGKLLGSINGFSRGGESVAYSPDGKMLVAGGEGSSAKLWDAATGAEIKTLRGRTAGLVAFIYSVAFAPDGKTIATAGIDNTIWLFDTATGQEVLNLTGQAEHLLSAAISTSGKMLALGGTNTVKAWNIRAGESLKTFAGYSIGNSAVAFSPDGTVTAAGSSVNNKIKLSETASGRELKVLEGHEGGVQSVAFSPDGRTLASASRDKTVKLWDVAAGKESGSFKGHAADVYAVAFAPDGATLASGGKDGVVKLWDIASRKERKSFAGKIGEIDSLSFSPDGKILAFGSRHVVRLWDVAADQEVKLFTGYTSPVWSIGFSRDGHLNASRSWDDTLKLWDVASGEELRSFAGLKKSIRFAAFSPDGKLIATTDENEKIIRLWDAISNKEIRTLAGHTGEINSLSFSVDGQTLASASDDRTVKLWDVAAGAEIKSFAGDDSYFYSAALSADGKTLAAGEYRSSYRLWDVASGREIKKFKGAETDIASITSIALSPDGKTLATGDSDGHLKLLDVASGKELRKLKGSDAVLSSVSAVAFSADGKTLASGDREATIKLWDVAAGQKLSSLPLPAPHFRREVFDAVPGYYLRHATGPATADGRFRFQIGDAGKLHLYEVKSGKLLATLVALGGKDWAVVTPEGLFDGTPAAWRQLIWRLDGHTFTYAPVEAFFKEFYRSGLLQDILAGRRVEPAARDLGQIDIRQPRVRINAIDDHPTDAREALVSDKRTVRVTVEITDNSDKLRRGGFPPASGSRDVRLFRNGSLVKLWGGDAFDKTSGCQPVPAQPGKPRRSLCRTDIKLGAGENLLTAFAFNSDDVKSADATLVVKGEESLRRKGTAYIVAAGVNRYAANPFFRDLKFAVADADEFAAEVKRQQEQLGRYEKVEVIKLTDEAATKSGLLGALDALAKKTQPEDAVIIYFAGHGLAEGGRFYLIPHDISPRDKEAQPAARREPAPAELAALLAARGLSDAELESAFENVDAGQLTMIIDACNSGQALGGEREGRGPMNSKGLAQLAYYKGMYVLTAAQSFQAALEAPQVGHGLLTYALVKEGLNQFAADGEPKDGAIHVREWLDYAAERVPKMQLDKMKAARGLGLDLSFKEEERGLDVEERSGQHPRVFYRRELEDQPLVVARPSAAQPQ